MSDCERYRELISRMIDEDLSEQERQELASHLSGCRECQTVYRAFSFLDEGLSDLAEEPPEELHEEIMASIRRQATAEKNSAVGKKRGVIEVFRNMSLGTRRVLTAAACFALVIALVAVGGGIGRMGSASPKLSNSSTSQSAPAQAAQESNGALFSASADTAATTEEFEAEAAAEPAPMPESTVAPADIDEVESYEGLWNKGVGAEYVGITNGDDYHRMLSLLNGKSAKLPGGRADKAWSVMYVVGEAPFETDIFVFGSSVYYYDADEFEIYKASCSVSEIEEFLSKLG